MKYNCNARNTIAYPHINFVVLEYSNLCTLNFCRIAKSRMLVKWFISVLLLPQFSENSCIIAVVGQAQCIL